MKVKAAVTKGIPEQVVETLNSPELAQLVFTKVAQKHLRVGKMGPAEFYVQECDLAVSCDKSLGCEVRLTGVSRNRYRSEQDFYDALNALEKEYRKAIENSLPARSDKRIQLFCVLMLDGFITTPDGKETNMLETEPIWLKSTLVP